MPLVHTLDWAQKIADSGPQPFHGVGVDFVNPIAIASPFVRLMTDRGVWADQVAKVSPIHQ
jgi:hypothetical protein